MQNNYLKFIIMFLAFTFACLNFILVLNETHCFNSIRHHNFIKTLKDLIEELDCVLKFKYGVENNNNISPIV